MFGSIFTNKLSLGQFFPKIKGSGRIRPKNWVLADFGPKIGFGHIFFHKWASYRYLPQMGFGSVWALKYGSCRFLPKNRVQADFGKKIVFEPIMDKKVCTGRFWAKN